MPFNNSQVQQFIALTNAAPYPPGGAPEAARLATIFKTVHDIPTVICRQIDLFESNNAYLVQALSIFDDADLLSVGIWFNKTQTSPPVTDPFMVVNSTITEIILNPVSPAVYKALAILGTSVIGSIVLSPGTELSEFRIGPGATVDVMDASLITTSPAQNAMVDRVWMTYGRSTPSRLNSIVYGSNINGVYIEGKSYYGGVKENPDNTCSEYVTNITATEVTHNAVFVSWTPPGNFLFVNTFYRKTNSQTWILATEVEGEFVDDSGFIFRSLEADTYYDFRVSVTCLNGGMASVDVTTQTVCCGAGTRLALYKVCPITILINTIPSPPGGQYLCNGVQIDLHYPQGATITIPYLATVNCAFIEPFVHNGTTYQNVVFNPATGTWDVSGTAIGTLVNGDVVSVSVSVPA